jgi:hypothetical protein
MEIIRSKWENAITTVLVPTEKVYKIKDGKKVIKDKDVTVEGIEEPIKNTNPARRQFFYKVLNGDIKNPEEFVKEFEYNSRKN